MSQTTSNKSTLRDLVCLRTLLLQRSSLFKSRFSDVTGVLLSHAPTCDIQMIVNGL